MNYENDQFSAVGEEESLMHYGKGHLDGGHSGRYPWGSGDDRFQRPDDFISFVSRLKSQGMSEPDIAKGLKMSSTDLRAYVTLADKFSRDPKIELARKLSKEKDENGKELSRSKIGKMIAEQLNVPVLGESMVRKFLDPNTKYKTDDLVDIAEFLMGQVDEFGPTDVGTKVEKILEEKFENSLGISKQKMDVALKMIEATGQYRLAYASVPQLTNPGKQTKTRILVPIDAPKNVAYQYKDIHYINDYKYSEDSRRIRKIEWPTSMDSKRLMVRDGDHGGKAKDGVIEIRRGVKDLSLGGSNYAQVRILVDGQYYLKGMAVYADDKDLPDGVDVIFNSNKPSSKPKLEHLKKTSDNLKKNPSNPFGSTISAQIYYDDPKGKYVDPVTGKKQSLGLINKRSDEGEWGEWSKEIASQMLSKQPKATISKQLNISMMERKKEYDEINSITNPTVKAKLLADFASDCDAQSVNLKAAQFDGQAYHVILPSTTLDVNEIYAPRYPHGSHLALVRFPHGGIFEIPHLVVNNKNKECINAISATPSDAVMINAKVAEQLSGADFDGDTVLTIPTDTPNTKIQYRSPLKDLEGFSTDEYGPDVPPVEDRNGNLHYFRNGKEYKIMQDNNFKQVQMGVVSNLITDMTLQGANEEELARAVKHSMVVIDAPKHKLDYTASYRENRINELKMKYQKRNDETGKKPYGGASTLISLAKNKSIVNKRAEGAYVLKDSGKEVESLFPYEGTFIDKETGEIFKREDVKIVKIDPKTGKQLYHETKETYTKIWPLKPKNSKDYLPAYIKNVDYKTGLWDGRYIRPRYIVPNDTEFFYFDKENNKFNLVDKTKQVVKQEMITEEIEKMKLHDDAFDLSSGTVQEKYYAEYANKLKAMANSARKDYLINDKNPVTYSPLANKEYKEEVNTLTAKLNIAERNAPKERQAQTMANAIFQEEKNNQVEESTPEQDKKRKQQILTEQRLIFGAKNQRFDVTDKEWEAIQMGAVTKNFLQRVLRYADQDRIRQLATPREDIKLTDSQIRRIRGYKEKGETTYAIAKRLGISASTVLKYLNGKEN